MPLVLLAIAAVLIVSAYQNTHGDLLRSLGQDVPGYVPLALAIGGTAAIGFIPKLSPIGRMLTGFLFMMYILNNWSAILAGFRGMSGLQGASAPTAATDPATQFATTGPFAASPTQIVGMSAGSAGTPAPVGPGATAPASLAHFANPTEFLTAYTAGFGGFGGHGA
jgi:hypothetical protein